MFKYQCGGCERVIKLKAEHLGRKLKCKCGIVFRAPEKSTFVSNPTRPSNSAAKQPAVQISCPACFTMLSARADLAGKLCKCSCGEKIRVPANDEIVVAQVAVASEVDMSDPLALPVAATAGSQSASKFQTRYNNPEAYKPVAPPKPKKTSSLPKRTQTRQTSSLLEGPAIGGIGMMLGAVIWFVVGWYAGYIFFYPPILFFIGLGSLVKALID